MDSYNGARKDRSASRKEGCPVCDGQWTTDHAQCGIRHNSTGQILHVDEVVFAQKGDLVLLEARSLEGLNLRVDSHLKKLVATGPLLAASGSRVHDHRLI